MRAISSYLLRLVARLLLLICVLILSAVLLGKIVPTSLIAFNLFASEDRQQLYVMDVHRVVMARFGQDSAFHSLPAWSPDGRQLAYISNQGASIVNVNTGERRTLTDYGTVRFISWSSDGRQIALDRVKPGQTDVKGDSGITILNLADGETHQFETPFLTLPRWIPNQQMIFAHYYLVDSATGSLDMDFMIINSTGDPVNRFAEYDFTLPGDLAISPDGQSVVFSAKPNMNSQIYDIYAITLDDMTTHHLTSHNGCCGAGDNSPSWSLDGNRIAYTSTPLGYPQIFVMNADGSDPHPITPNPQLSKNPTSASHPIWSPDGKQIIFEVSSSQGMQALCIVDADGQNMRTLVSGTSISKAWEAAWQP